MLDVFDLQNFPRIDQKIFTWSWLNPSVGSFNWKVWQKPRGVNFAHIFALGGGGGGGNGIAGSLGAAGGGGGGANGNQISMILPIWALPDILYISVAGPAAALATGDSTTISVTPSTNLVDNNQTYFSISANGGAASGTASAGGAGGSGNAVNPSNNFTTPGAWFATNVGYMTSSGVSGTTGGFNAAGLPFTFPTGTGAISMGGTGGGGLASVAGTSFDGGSYTQPTAPTMDEFNNPPTGGVGGVLVPTAVSGQAGGNIVPYGTTISYTLPSSVQVGSLIVVSVSTGGSMYPGTVSVSQSGTGAVGSFTLDNSSGIALPDGQYAYIWSGIVTTAGSLTVTVTTAAYVYLVLTANEYTGSWTADRVESTSSNTQYTSTVVSSGNVVSAGGGLLVGVLAVSNGAVTTLTPSSGWSTVFQSNDGTSQEVGACTYRISSTAITDAAGWTISDPAVNYTVAIAVAYKLKGAVNNGSNGANGSLVFTPGKFNFFYGGTGGGSGGTSGGNGGNGGLGAGGGGGGGCLTGNTPGTGGQGGPGLVVITCW